ncbi:MAG: DUF4870 domain-containing protein [Akkermansia sp.]
MAVFSELPGVNIIPPLICWLVWKDANPLVDKVGKNILNAQISWAIYTVAACLSCLILIGFVLAPVVVIAWTFSPLSLPSRRRTGITITWRPSRLRS